MTSTFAKTEKSTLPSVAEDPRWARIVARDKTADGHLWYSVYTTGVYCRPSCPSRTANPKNVQLHDTMESATATGVTPKDYAAAGRAAKVRQGLASGSSVTEAIYGAGFNSSGRFYEKSTDMLGMTPSQYRAGGTNEEIKFAVGQTSL